IVAIADLLLGVGTFGKGRKGRRAIAVLRPFAYNTSRRSPTPPRSPGNAKAPGQSFALPRGLPLPIGAVWPGRSVLHPKGARQCFAFWGEGRKGRRTRGGSSIRGVFLVLARHERRSRCCGVDR